MVSVNAFSRAWACRVSPSARSTPSSASRSFPWRAERSNSAWATVRAASASWASWALQSASIFWAWVWSRWSSLARERIPALLLAEPPVMEPPGFIT